MTAIDPMTGREVSAPIRATGLFERAWTAFWPLIAILGFAAGASSGSPVPRANVAIRSWRLKPQPEGVVRNSRGSDPWHGNVDVEWAIFVCRFYRMLIPTSVTNSCRRSTGPRSRKTLWILLGYGGAILGLLLLAGFVFGSGLSVALDDPREALA